MDMNSLTKTVPIRKKHRIFELDATRALAIVLVVLFHLEVSFLNFGYIGVDIFFVLSGYLMVNIVLEEKKSTGFIDVRRFLFRRFVRIYPSLVATTIFTLILAFLCFSPSHLEDVATQAYRTLTITSNLLFYNQNNYFAPANEIRPLLHTWSLSVEEQFYLLFAILLFVSRWINATHLFLLLFFIGILAWISTMYLWQVDLQSSNRLFGWLPAEKSEEAIFYLLPFRLVQLSAGGALVILHRQTTFEPVSGFFAATAAITALSVLIASSFLQSNMVSHAAAVVGAILLLHPNKLMAKIGKTLPIRFLAKISYQIYLVHWPIIVFWRYLTFEKLQGLEQIAIFVLSLILGWLLWRSTNTLLSFESGDLATRQNLRNKRIVFALFTLALGSVVFSIWVENNDGHAWRIPENRQSFSSQQLRDEESSYCGTSHLRNGHEIGATPGDPLITCTINPTGKQTIYVFGDSHARHLGPGLAEHFPKYKVKILYFTSCHAQSGSANYKYDYEGRDALAKGCLDRNMRALKFFETEEPATILIHQFAGYHSDQSEAFFDAAHSLIVRLRSEGHKVLWVGPVVRPDKVVSECASVPFSFPTFFLKRRCSGDPEAAKIVLEYSANLKSKFKDIFIDISPYFCEDKDPNSCRTISENGQPIFRDKHHLSVFGSQEVIEYIKAPLTSVFEEDLLNKATN